MHIVIWLRYSTNRAEIQDASLDINTTQAFSEYLDLFLNSIVLILLFLMQHSYI